MMLRKIFIFVVPLILNLSNNKAITSRQFDSNNDQLIVLKKNIIKELQQLNIFMVADYIFCVFD